MSTQITKDTFEVFYNATYKNVLKYTICHCKNLDDVNDIVQDIYTELYQRISKKTLKLENTEAYVIGIARKKIKGNYSLNQKVFVYEINEEIDIISENNIDIESNLINKDNVMQVWNYLKSKSELTARIFYLYYVMEIPIKTISSDIGLTESNVKNHLYRTQKELKEKFKKGDGYNVR